MKKVKKTGLPPGSVVFTGNRKVEEIGIHYLRYNNSLLEEKKLTNQKQIVFHQAETDCIDWYDIRGLHDTQLIEAIGNIFHVHPLIQEDIADTHQRPKFEEYENGIFVIIRALEYDTTQKKIRTEQVAIYLTHGLVLTFQETASDLFEKVRSRIHSGRGKIRQRGADYLGYALLDVLVDHYFNVLENIEQEITDFEEALLDDPDISIREQIHQIKKELLFARKSVLPLREAIGRLSKVDNELIKPQTLLFTRDLHDNIVQIMDMIENYRDMLNGLQDLHLSEISFKMNQIMQVLTVITTIFVPLSFLTGLYGMNFDNIPELHFKYGYFILLLVMFCIAGGLLLWFNRRKWL